MDEGGEFRAVIQATFTTPVGDNWKLQLIIRDFYNSQPAAGNVKNDLTVIVTLVVTF